MISLIHQFFSQWHNVQLQWLNEEAMGHNEAEKIRALEMHVSMAQMCVAYIMYLHFFHFFRVRLAYQLVSGTSLSYGVEHSGRVMELRQAHGPQILAGVVMFVNHSRWTYMYMYMSVVMEREGQQYMYLRNCMLSHCTSREAARDVPSNMCAHVA